MRSDRKWTSLKGGDLMKNGKKLTKREKMHVKSYSLNPENWLVSKKGNGQMYLVHRYTNTKRVIPSL